MLSHGQRQSGHLLIATLLALIAVGGVASGALLYAHEVTAHTEHAGESPDHHHPEDAPNSESDCLTCHLLTSLRAEAPTPAATVTWNNLCLGPAIRPIQRVESLDSHHLPPTRGPPSC